MSEPAGSLVPFLLHQAEVSLWPAGPDGSALTAFPIWFGACADTFSANMGLREIAGLDSGLPYRRAYHADEEWELEINRLWAMRTATLGGWFPERNGGYVLQVRWYDRDRGVGYQRCWFGVTGRVVATGSKEALESRTRQVFRAEQMAEDVADLDSDPLPLPLPLTVWYVDGALRLKAYDYDPATAVFTATSANIGQLVTVANNPVSVKFTPSGTEWLTWDGTQLVVPTVRVASGVAIPCHAHVEFRRGRRVLAALSNAGLLRVHRYVDATPSATVGTAGFDLKNGGVIVATIDDSLTCDMVDATPSGAWDDCGCTPSDGDSIPVETADSTFIYEVPIASTVWTVPHNLGRYPSVTTVESTMTEIHGTVAYLDVNTLQITFNAAYSGTVYLN